MSRRCRAVHRSPVARFLTALAALSVAVASTGCGLLGGGSAEPSGSGKGLEKGTIKVAITTTTDLASFHIARTKGYFAKEGLKVEFITVPSASDGVTKLNAGEVDLAYAGYSTFFTMESKGAFKNKGGLKMVADSGSAAPDSNVVVATPSSPVKTIQDLPGKNVGVAVLRGTTELLVRVALKEHHVSAKNVHWVQVPFPSTAQALKAKRIDAAFAAEPFIQDTKRRAGARQIVDCATGAAKDLPLTGWSATGDFVENNPKTVAAFQRAMQRGTKLAIADRELVNEILVKYSKVDEQTAQAAKLLGFESKLSAARLQRTADLMQDVGFLDERLDVKPMIVPTAPLKS